MPRKTPPKNHQNDLFGQTLRHTHLIAPESPEKAFFALWLESEFGQYVVRKESGPKGKVRDLRRWVFDSLGAAERDFDRRLRQKLNPARKSPRKYVEMGAK